MKYADFKESEFFSFFNLSEVRKEEFSSDRKKVALMTGGFQEHINLYLNITKDGEIKTAELFLDREWIGDTDSINPFGTDLAKSFISLIIPTNEESGFKEHLAHYLFNLRGNKQVLIPLHRAFVNFEESVPEITPFLEVYRNLKNKMTRKTDDYILRMENLNQNEKERLLIRIEMR